ncbi:choice-of-anchor J domain-containing protein [Fluviicola taffensis]|uniref:T9SS-dependent choice-of-anchor J family protein n=1 Tax=Fluviicola taffensis TaxID=191579 RepID=UPI003137FA52
MKTRILKTAALCGLFVLGSISKYNAQSYTELFNDITTLPGNGWFIQNNSTPVGSVSWFQGTPPATGPFIAYNGADNAYIGVNFNSTGSTGTISNWLLTPNRTLRNGDVFTFYTRTAAEATEYPDRLEVRLSTNGASTNVGSGATATGDFTTLLLSVNPTLVTGVYPQVWTQYTITISGLPAPTSGRIAFRYFVTSAGSLGTNSNYIGIDQVDYIPYVCPAFTMTAGGALTGGAAGSAYSLTLTQTGALGAPNFAVTAGAIPPGLTLSTDGTISGTPTATGTFNFTATVSDASGCTGSQSYSITVVCPANPITLTTPPALCDNAGTYTLVEGSPAGGTYSGTGVTGGAFDPTMGTQTVTYDYTDPYGCAFNSNYAITVNTSPIVTLSSIAPVCDNSGTLALTGESPAGGTYSGTGVTGTDFDPMAGTQTITYTYTDANGCTNNASTTITVNIAPIVTQGAVSAVCSNAAPVALTGGSPVGGTYSGTGVNASGDFDPSAGTQTVTYTYTDANNCTNAATTSITVNPAPTVSFTSPVSTMCVNHAPLTLSGGSPAGGTYSGAGVSGGVLNPATAGAGDHVITYSFTDANGCDGEAMFTIHVDACLGLTENSQEFGLEIYPNPTTGMFTAKVTSGADFSIVNVVDIQGKAIQFGSSNSSAQTVDVDFSNQAPGMYFVTGLVDGQQITFRVQKN